MIWPSECKPMSPIEQGNPLTRGLVCAARMDRPGSVVSNLVYPHLLSGAVAPEGVATPIVATHQDWYNRFGSGYTFCLWHDGITLPAAWESFLDVSDSTVTWLRYGSNNCLRAYHNGTGYTLPNVLITDVADPGLLICTWAPPALKVYIDGAMIDNVACYLAPKTTSSISTLTVGGSTTVSQLLAYDRPLSGDEIQRLSREPSAPFDCRLAWPPVVAAGGTTHDLAGSVEVASSPSGAARVVRGVSGQIPGRSSLTAIAKCTRGLLGQCSVQSSLTGTLAVGNVVPLSGTVQANLFMYASLSIQSSEATTPISPGWRPWRRAVLCNGMTADGFKLSTVLTRGWFWTRRLGCLAVYHGPTAEQVDFDHLVYVAGSDTQKVPLPEFLLPDAGSKSCYVVRRFNGYGDQEHTTRACVVVRVDDDGKLARPTPNDVFALHCVRVSEDSLRLQWSYCPLDQQVSPARFNVYISNAPGQIDFETPLKIAPYRGPGHYHGLIDVPSQEPRDFVVRAETADGVEAIPGRMLNWQGRTTLPQAITLLTAEGIL